MSLELFINSGSITEIDLSRIDGVRFEDAFSVSSTSCAYLYYNVQDFSIPPITPPDVLNIPQTNYLMFDENASSDWDATTPTKIRISLKALGRILDRTSYQQKLFDIIKNSRVDSEITITKQSTSGDSFKKFKVIDANYFERIYDESGQKFYSFEWGGTDLVETADFLGLFDYLPSSEDRKDGFFTLTVEQIDSGVNTSEPPSQGDELLICIKPSSKYGLLDVGDATFDTITVDNIEITSASIDSLIIGDNVTFLNTASIEEIAQKAVSQRLERTVYTTPQYVPVPKWANEVRVICVGGGGGGGAGVDLNDAHFTIGGAGGSGGTISYKDLFSYISKGVYTSEVLERDADGVITKQITRPLKELDWVVYVHPGAGGRGGEVNNSLVIEDEDDALRKLLQVWDSYYGSSHYQSSTSNFPNEAYYGSRPYFFGLNPDYAYSLIIGDLSTKYIEGPIDAYVYGYKDGKYGSHRFYEITGINRTGDYQWKNRLYSFWFRNVFVKMQFGFNTQLGQRTYDITHFEDNKNANHWILNSYPEMSTYYPLYSIANKNLKKMYKSRSGSNGSPSYACIIDFTNINKETDVNKKSQMLKDAFELNTKWETKGLLQLWAAGGSGGEGGIAIKYSTLMKQRRYWSPNSRPKTVIDFEITPFGKNWKNHWAVAGFSGALFVLKNDTAPSNITTGLTGEAFTKLYNPIPFVEAAATENPSMEENMAANSIYISDAFKQWSLYSYDLGIFLNTENLSDPIVFRQHDAYRGGHGGLGTVEPLHYDSVITLKSNRNKLWGLEGEKWSLPGSAWYYDKDKSNPARRGTPADYYLNSSPNAPQNWITDTSPTSFFMSIYDDGHLFTRVNRWAYDTSGIDLSELTWQNAAQRLAQYPKRRTPFSRPPYFDAYQTAKTGVTGGGGGTGWAGFDPIGKVNPDDPIIIEIFDGINYPLGEAIIDIMDMPKEYLANLKALNPVSSNVDFVSLNFYNYGNHKHIRVGKGGKHRELTVGDNRYQIGGDGGNAIRRWVVEEAGTNQFEKTLYNIKTVLEPSLPYGTDPNPPIVDGVPVISWGAGGGGGGAGGIDIGSVNPADIIVDTDSRTAGGQVSTELNQRTAVRIPLYALLDENNNWRTVPAQNGADGVTGVVIVEFRS